MINSFRQIIDALKKLNYVLSAQQKKYGIGVLILSIIGAFFEMIGVSVIIPVVQAIMYPEQLKNNAYFGYILKCVGINDKNGIIFFVCGIVVVVYIAKNVYLIFLSWVRVKYSCKVMRELSIKAMNSYMKREYSFFSGIGMGELIRGTNGDASGIYCIIYQGFRIISEGLSAFFICIYIIITDYKLATSIIIVGLFCLTLIMAVFKKMIKKFAERSYKYSALVSKYMLEAYSGIKEILVMHRQKYFISKYEEAYVQQQRGTTGSTVVSESPAYIIEAFCISGIIISVAFRVQGMEDPVSFIPQLSAFAIAAFKIMPSLGKISGAANLVLYHIPYLNNAYVDFKEVENSDKKRNMDIENDHFSKSSFNSVMKIDNISWKYPEAEKTVICNLSIEIHKGESIGIIGESGAGKSTLMDIILGLYKPQKGTIKVDGVNIVDMPLSWCKMIGYVPQTVYLTDDTIRKNVAFGIEDNCISDEKIWGVLKEAQIDKFVSTLPNGLDTIVGDRGIKFSGGQRQRIAIARALYYDPDIIVFDEATSALDNDTENALMEAIESLHGRKTTIIVAHRLSTIKNCDKVYEIYGGKALLR